MASTTFRANFVKPTQIPFQCFSYVFLGLPTIFGDFWPYILFLMNFLVFLE